MCWRPVRMGLGHRDGWRHFCDSVWPGNYESSVWLFPGENPPMKFKRSRWSLSSVMWPLSRFRRERLSAPRGTCQLKIFEVWSACLPDSGTYGLLLHHDNASAHTAVATLNYLEENPLSWSSTHPVFPGLSPLWFLFVLSSEATFEGEAVWGRRRCSSLLRGRDFWHPSVNVVWCHGHRVWKDDIVRSWWRGMGYFENWTRQKNPYVRSDLHIQTLVGWPWNFINSSTSWKNNTHPHIHTHARARAHTHRGMHCCH